MRAAQGCGRTPGVPTDKRGEAARLRAEGLTLRAVGDALGVCGERARQLLLPPHRRCKGCGKAIDLPRVQYHPGCRPARRVRPRPAPAEATCRRCGAAFARRHGLQAYCSPGCRAGAGPAGDGPGGRRPADLRGRPFGHWVVLDEPPARRGRHTLWKCRCRCGAEGCVPADKLVAGTSTRCRRCAIGATWPKTCPACGRAYLGTTRQAYCSPGCRPRRPAGRAG